MKEILIIIVNDKKFADVQVKYVLEQEVLVNMFDGERNDVLKDLLLL